VELAKRLPDCRARVDAQFDHVLKPFRAAHAQRRDTERPIVASAAL